MCCCAVSPATWFVCLLFTLQMMKFAWDNYKRYAWGKNELRPLTRNGHIGNMFGECRRYEAICHLFFTPRDGLIQAVKYSEVNVGSTRLFWAKSSSWILSLTWGTFLQQTAPLKWNGSISVSLHGSSFKHKAHIVHHTTLFYSSVSLFLLRWYKN